MKRSILLLPVLLLAFFASVGDAAAEDSSDLLLILDASGSMWGQIDGENKIVIARRVLGGIVDGLEDDSEVGVIAYGHRREGDCQDIETVVPIATLDRAALKRTVDGLNPKGKTPITRAVQHGFETLRPRGGGATVILVSDGLETCDGDPCAAVRTAREQGIEFVMHVVGFDVQGEDLSSLECMAQAGGGLFRSAENANELSQALEAAVALPAEVPAGLLSVEVVADGELQDASVHVEDRAGAQAGGGRTYTRPETNPRRIPLADGRYSVKVRAVGIRGDVERTFEIEIVDGSTVERKFDFSTGTIFVGVTRNGELSDAVYRVKVPATGEEVAKGRTYRAATSNPARKRITSGTYDVSIRSVEIKNRPWVDLGPVTLEPGGAATVSHDYASGTLRIGARRDGELVDATIDVVDVATGKSVAGGRTYASEKSNPKSFLLEPGEYDVTVKELRGERRTIRVRVERGETLERFVE